MQIVIDIPKAAYTACKAVKNLEDNGSNPLMSCLMDVVAHGTVLPEKHGRLIDADAIKQKYPLMYNDFGMEFNNGIHEALDEAPTILEAR